MLRDSHEVHAVDVAVMSESSSDRQRRRELGIYYTPPEAAKTLARWAIRRPEETVLEPSFGGCAMLSAAVSVLRTLGNPDPSPQLYGYDVDAAAFEHLAQLGVDNGTGNFKKQDFLRASSVDLKVNAVLANPPFVSHHRQSETQRRLTNKLRKKYLPALPRLASLWAFFVLHSMSFLRPGGRMAFVLPNSVGTSDYGKPLLEYLRNHFSRVELVHVGERLFIQAGADERIALLLLSDYIPMGNAEPAPIYVRNILKISEVELSNGSNTTSDKLNCDLDTRSEAGMELAKHSDALTTLEMQAFVQIGEVVGDIRNLVKPLAEWRSLGIDSTYLVPLLSRAAQIVGLSIPASVIHEVSTTIPYLLLPPAESLPKSIAAFLERYTSEEILKNRTFQKRSIWYRCSYETGADAFIGSMSHDYPRIIGNDAGISCSNAFYKIRLFNNLKMAKWLPILSLTTPLRLSAEVMGRIRGSGGIKLEPSDVKKLQLPRSLPDIPSADFNALKQKLNSLAREGKLDVASRLADSIVYIEPGLISVADMTSMHKMLLRLTGWRLYKQV